MSRRETPLRKLPASQETMQHNSLPAPSFLPVDAGAGASLSTPEVVLSETRSPDSRSRLPGQGNRSCSYHAPRRQGSAASAPRAHQAEGLRYYRIWSPPLIVRTRNPGGGLTGLARRLSKPQERAETDPRAGGVSTPKRSAALTATLLADTLR